MRAGERGFDDLDGGCSQIVFRAEGNDRAASMKNVANELEGSSAHEARRINAKGNVVNGLSAMNSFGNHELFVLGPGKLGRSFGGAGAGIACRLRSLEQTSDHFVEGVKGGELRILLVRGQHRLKTVGRREHNLSKLGAV